MKKWKLVLIISACVLLVCFIFRFLIIGGNNSCPLSHHTEETVSTSNVVNNPKVKVSFIDVGQGDATLIQAGEDTVLIDAGPPDDNDQLISYIDDCNCSDIDYLICTHPHLDHYGEINDILDKYKVINFFTPKSECKDNPWASTITKIRKSGVHEETLSLGQTLEFDDFTMQYLSPITPIEYDDYNDYSAVFKLSCGEVDFLLMGDATGIIEHQMLSKYDPTDLDCEVLKVGHHGSKTSSFPEFISAVAPDYSVISCGKDNEYGHPHKKTLNTLSKYDSKLYRTDINGTVECLTDGIGLYIKTIK